MTKCKFQLISWISMWKTYHNCDHANKHTTNLTSHLLVLFVCLWQKYEKPKFVQCLAFLNNGDILAGDSGGIMLIWTRSTAEPAPGKGPKGRHSSHTHTHTHTGTDIIITASILKHILHINILQICPLLPAFPFKKYFGGKLWYPPSNAVWSSALLHALKLLTLRKNKGSRMRPDACRVNA